MSNRTEIDTVTWHPYAVGSLPSEDWIIDERPYPIPVIVRFENGAEDEDWISGGELFLYCEKSCGWLLGHPIEWRYQYDKADFERRIRDQRKTRRAAP